MGLTVRDRRDRKRGIGASQNAAVCGYDEWENAYDVWIEKVYAQEGEEEEEQKETGPIHLGNILEEALIRDCAERFDLPNMKRHQVRVGANKISRANLDGLSINSYRVGAEAKVSSISDGWGDEFDEHQERTDLVPKRVLFQTSQQIYAAKLDYLYVVALLVHRGRLVERFYRIERNDDFIRYWLPIHDEFWNYNVLEKVPPKEVVPSMASIKAIKRVEGSVVELGENVVALEDYANWILAKATAKAADDRVDESKSRFLAHMGDNVQADLGPVIGREVSMGARSRTNFGRSDKYQNHCETCGVGSHKSSWWQPSDRKRRA